MLLSNLSRHLQAGSWSTKATIGQRRWFSALLILLGPMILKITVKNRNFCLAGVVVVSHQIVGGRSGRRGRVGTGGQDSGAVGEEIGQPDTTMSTLSTTICKKSWRIVYSPWFDLLVINENNNDFDFEIE